MSQLSDHAQRVLGVGALFETAFPLPVAADVAGLEEDEGLDAIDEALESQVVLATDTFDHYQFSHALFRQTLVGELNPSRQVRMHRSIAEALEKRLTGPPTPAQAPALAWHWQRSAALPGAERGVPALLVVADDATKRYAYREAFDAFTIALELLLDGDERAAGIHLSRAAAAISIHADEEAIVADVRMAADLIASSDGDDVAADLVSDLVTQAMLTDDRSIGWALAKVGSRYLSKDRRDRTWARLRDAELQQGEFADREHSGLPIDNEQRRELQAVIESLPPQDVEGLFFWPSSHAAALDFLSRHTLRMSRFVALWSVGDVGALISLMEEAIVEHRRTANTNMLLLFEDVLARYLTVAGRHDEADLTLASAFADLSRVSPTSNAAFQTLAAASLIDFVRGRLPIALSIEQIAELSAHPDTRWVSVAVTATASVSCASDGDIERAIAYIAEAAMSIDLAPGYIPNYSLIACMICHALWILDRTDHLDLIERNLLSKIVEPDLRYPEVVPQLALARLCALDGRINAARDWIGRAREVVIVQDTPPLGVQIDHFEAELELRLGPDGDPVRFRSVVQSARAACEHPAMASWLTVFDLLEQKAEVLWS